MAWQRVASVKDVTEGDGFAVTVGSLEIALYKLGDKYFALEDVCPHAYALLSTGFVEGEKVSCPMHGAEFHIPTGKCLGPPADRDLATYPVKIEGDDLLIDA
ncbi:MAG TPA: non-heme iron oxygenase ferredoxin subunit [Alphaproteobacteria bacterium]|nr:non-heme iron oxygenase ferredoxin subunit [Alphaproteobacteria bacterium]